MGPPLPPVTDVLKATLIWDVGSDLNVQCVTHWEYSGGPPTGADCTTLAGLIRSSMNTNGTTLLNNSFFFSGVDVLDLNSSSGASGIHISNFAGTRSGVDLTGGTAVLVNHAISRRYRGGKPKSFLPWGVAGDLLTPQTWTTGLVSAADTAWANFVTGVIGSVGGSTTIASHVNVSYFQGFTNVPYGSPTKYRRVPTLRSGGPVVDVITSSSINNRPSSQRRRL